MWYVTGIHKEQMQRALGNRSILGTADMAKTLPCPAEMDQYLRFDTVKNSVRKFTGCTRKFNFS